MPIYNIYYNNMVTTNNMLSNNNTYNIIANYVQDIIFFLLREKLIIKIR